MASPLLSIVIANYNYGRFLEAAIQSVLSQDMADVTELIICDAASTDNSIDVIKKYACGLPPNTPREEWKDNFERASNATHISWWCSEKDGGQSAAFNKGFSHAKGDWITWLNADDILLPGTISAFVSLLGKVREAAWVSGNMLSFDSETGKIVRVYWGPNKQPPLLHGRRAFSAVFGPTTFWKKSLYNSIGPIDENLHYAMDTEYWARLTLAGVRQVRLNHICWGFRIHEQSKTLGRQTNLVCDKRAKETAYWKSRSGYDFKPKISNFWYLLWVLWRIVDGSWIKRYYLRKKWEGKPLRIICDYD